MRETTLRPVGAAPDGHLCSADGLGERYLVAGDATFVWACGFTQLWDAAVAAQWSAALGG